AISRNRAAPSPTTPATSRRRSVCGAPLEPPETRAFLDIGTPDGWSTLSYMASHGRQTFGVEDHENGTIAVVIDDHPFSLRLRGDGALGAELGRGDRRDLPVQVLAEPEEQAARQLRRPEHAGIDRLHVIGV